MGVVRGGDQPQQSVALWQECGNGVGQGVGCIIMYIGGVDGAAADGVVLAVDAVEVAVGEEHVDQSGQRGFLAAVDANGSHLQAGRRAAVAGSGGAVGAAAARAEVAGVQSQLHTA